MASAGEKALHTALRKRVFDPVYYFHGDDDFLKDARTRELVEVAVDSATRDFNLEHRRGGDLDAEALDALLGTPPLLAARRVVVIRDVDKLKKDARRTLDGYLKRPAPDLLLVLSTPAGVKSDKTLSAHATAVEFSPLTGERIPKWVAFHVETVLGRTITTDAIALLVEAVGSDLAQIAVELEKLTSYADAEIDEAAVSAIVGVRRGESLSSFLDAVAAKDARTALPLIAPLLQQPKTTAVSVVMALTTQTLALSYGVGARAEGVSSHSQFNEYMGLLRETGAFPSRPWGDAAGAWARNTERWRQDELDRALSALVATDAALKETRLSSEEQLITSLVLALCGDRGAGSRAA